MSIPDPQAIAQWIDEIQALKQQITELKRDRDTGYADADRWRDRYMTEAQQRRTETQTAQRTIAALHREIEQLRGSLAIALDRSIEGIDLPDPAMLTPNLDTATAPAPTEQQQLRELREQVLMLSEALAAEKRNHEETRQSLTLALGDTMDVLNQERSRRNSS
jgi:FtsZ-binding cell division protein ZapB